MLCCTASGTKPPGTEPAEATANGAREEEEDEGTLPSGVGNPPAQGSGPCEGDTA